MTSSTPAYPLPQNLQVPFSDHVKQPEHQRSAARSVAAHIARSASVVEQVRAAEAERAKLLAVINAPLRRLIEGDPAAARALDELRNQQSPNIDGLRNLQRMGLEPASSARGDRPVFDIKDVAAGGARVLA